MTTEEQIELYCQEKVKESIITKHLKELGGTLKQEMLNKGVRELSAGRFSVQLEIRTEQGIDETKMLGVLKDYWEKTHSGEGCPFIRTVEVIDEDALEAFLYNTQLPEDMILSLDACKTSKVTQAIKYKIAKGDK